FLRFCLAFRGIAARLRRSNYCDAERAADADARPLSATRTSVGCVIQDSMKCCIEAVHQPHFRRVFATGARNDGAPCFEMPCRVRVNGAVLPARDSGEI